MIDNKKKAQQLYLEANNYYLHWNYKFNGASPYPFPLQQKGVYGFLLAPCNLYYPSRTSCYSYYNIFLANDSLV